MSFNEESGKHGPWASYKPQKFRGMEHLPTYLLFVPFWVLNEHHHVSLPSTDGVHSELGRLFHHVSCRLDSCQVYTGTLQAGWGFDIDHSSPTMFPSGNWEMGPSPAAAMWETGMPVTRIIKQVKNPKFVLVILFYFKFNFILLFK